MVKRKEIVVKKKKAKKTIRVVKKQDGVSAVGRALRMLGGVGGSALGSMVGMSGIGKDVGTGLGATLSKFLGAGDYTVKSNSMVQRFSASGSIPAMHKEGQSIVVRHKEYLGDINGSSAFTNQVILPLNPGLSATFPWLAAIAQNFQEYTIRGMVFEYCSRSADALNSTNTALGTVIMATQYRATSSDFINKQQMENEYFSSSQRPSEDFCHPIECDPKENPYNVQYIRGGSVPSGEDKKTYDLGTFYLSTEGMQAVANIGELWVTYEIELRKPALSSGLNLYGKSAHYYSTSGASAAAFFTNIKVSTDSIGLTFTTTKITFPLGTQGNYLVAVAAASCTQFDISNWVTSGTLVNATQVMTTNGSLSSNGANSKYSVGTNYGTAFTILQIADPTTVASFTPSISSYTGGTQMDVVVAQLQYNTI